MDDKEDHSISTVTQNSSKLVKVSELENGWGSSECHRTIVVSRDPCQLRGYRIDRIVRILPELV